MTVGSWIRHGSLAAVEAGVGQLEEAAERIAAIGALALGADELQAYHKAAGPEEEPPPAGTEGHPAALDQLEGLGVLLARRLQTP